MTPFHTADNVTIYNAPALDLLRTMADDSVVCLTNAKAAIQ